MPIITLPDGSQRPFDHPVTVYDVAQNIGAGLAKAALAGKVDDHLVDTFYTIEHDAKLRIITDKDPEGLEIIRHSTAHLLAQAVKALYPSAQITIGPVIEDGFYYDIAIETPFTMDDLPRIEAKMHEIANQNLTVSRRTMKREEAISFFRKMGEEYKAKIIEAIPIHETLSLYQQGDFIDLCRGPHVPNTGKLKIFKLMKIAGAYWRGDSNNEMLQRIYGTAWADQKSLDAYLHRLEEAEKRDHRKIAKALDLFHMQEEAPGMVFWHPKGWTLYQIIEQHMRGLMQANGYQEVRTPQILDRSLWEKSGHWEKFQKEMFITESEKRTYAIKPMNCPCHIQIFNSSLRSYRDLPLRLSEFGGLHRNEPSGSLHGLMRVRHLVQDDAHIFCQEDQIQSEITQFIKLFFETYADFGFAGLTYRLATRPTNRIGADEQWDKAEHALEQALNANDLKWDLAPGEGAFYGPKIEFHLKDSIGRSWQCGTVQVDFLMPERLGAEYIAEDNTRKVPVMIHRAILGSIERFIGILIEHYAGNFPLWLAPCQVAILTITDKHNDYAKEVSNFLKNRGFRVKSDLRNEKIGYKIREQTLQKIPYLLVLGDKELGSKTVAVRTQKGEDLGSLSLEAFAQQLDHHIAQRGRIKVEE